MNSMLEKMEIRASESKISKNSDTLLFTRLEGSGTAVVFYDPDVHIGGLLHYELPSARDSAAIAKPYQYAETGIEKTLFSLFEAGAEWDRLIIKLCGAAISGNDENQDSVSRRNVLAARKVFWRLGLFIKNLDVGGDKSRELYFNTADGTVTVRSEGKEKQI